MIDNQDTIAAVSTPQGRGALGIVRMSGPKAISIARRIFSPKGKKDVLSISSFTLNYGWVKTNGSVIDEALLSVMRAPKTYTREDIVEISLHGGMVSLQKVLELCIRNGARLAEPGEFTKRAFMNGRIDLAQAEAVCDIVNARSQCSHRAAVQQLVGHLSNRIGRIRDDMAEILAELETAVDFPEEGIQFDSREEILRKVGHIRGECEAILATFETGRIYKEGLTVVIAGRPNVGKSSLINAMLRENRAIVTEIPGTTRDIISEEVEIKGLKVNLMDTAGIGEAKDKIDAIGIQKTMDSIESSDLVLIVVDLSEGISDDDKQIVTCIRDKKSIIIANKKDLPHKVREEEIGNALGKDIPIIKTSALLGEGIEEIEDLIYRMFIQEGISEKESPVITNLRHKEALQNLREALLKAERATKHGMSEEFIACDIRDALRHIGEITGQTTTEGILDIIFSKFCIGK